MTDHLDPRVHNFLNKKESSNSLVELAKKKMVGRSLSFQ